MGGGSSPCASCKLLRRRCTKDCVFAPYFPPDDPHKFAIVHKVFGASNISKMLQELPVHKRTDAVSSLVYEANSRMRDPVYGCVGAISYLQNQVAQLQMQLAVAQAEILCIQMQQEPPNLQPQLVEPTDENCLLFASNDLDYNLQQYLSFASSSSSSSVMQDSVKRESLCTVDPSGDQFVPKRSTTYMFGM
ncbi:LOB domain-containing protein 12 [Abeliophyllum distichum]|uniref:LOB domain-containing protein 12 n=1 Tax=Abeliophyllum distichum TaxID=126358 RepID=A0ABD1Q442_9LAMI